MNTELFELVVPDADLGIVNSGDDLIVELGHKLFLVNTLDHPLYFSTKYQKHFYDLVVEAKELLEHKGYSVKVTPHDVKIIQLYR